MQTDFKNLNKNNFEILNPPMASPTDTDSHDSPQAVGELCKVQNDQNNYYKTLDENFNAALELLNKDFSHDDLIAMLKNDNIVQKQFAALNLDEITSVADAHALTDNLTGQDGKVREAVALTINRLISDYFFDEDIYDSFLQGVIDVNGNVCRNIIAAVCKIKHNAEFCKYFSDKLISMTFDIIPKIEDFNERDGKYKVNKEFFKLYWCLEVLYEFIDYIAPEKLKKLLTKTKNCDEYTIREKTAKILSSIKNHPDFDIMKEELKRDKNYYVRLAADF